MRVIHATIIVTVLMSFAPSNGFASMVTFNIDPAQSQLTITKLVAFFVEFPIPGSAFGVIDLMGQGPGALDATYSGTLLANVDLNGGTFQFVGGSSIVADSSQNWYPIVPSPGVGFTGPANYGVTAITSGSQIDNHSLYGFVLDAVGSLKSVSGTGPYSFDAATTFTNLEGTIGHFTTLNNLIESFDVTGNTGTSLPATATLSNIGGDEYKLTLPVDVRLPLFSQLIFGSETLIEARFVGQLTGTATIPELGSAALVMIGSVFSTGVVLARVRRRSVVSA